ncbi:MAG: hypothetical protein IJ757_01550 [Clostridiales bacterium]|nr:hypothetical protein [Clostridiales bacterium]
MFNNFIVALDNWILPLLAILTILFDYKDKKLQILVSFLFVFFFYSRTLEHYRLLTTFTYHSAYRIACFVIAAKGRSFKTMAQSYLVVETLLMLLTTVLATTGVIPDLIFEEAGRAGRHSLGFSYPLHYIAHWLTIAILFCYLKKGFLKPWDYLGLGMICALSGYMCKAQTTTVLLVLLTVGTLVRQLYYYVLRKRQEKPGLAVIRMREKGMFIFKNIFLILMLFMIVGALLFVPPISTYLSGITPLSTFFSRFEYGRVGLLEYFPTMLGRSFPFRTWIGTTKVENYFSIDSSYILIPIFFGVLGTPIFMAGLWYFPHRLYQYKQGYVLFLISFFAFLCTMEHRMFYISYNIFWLMLFSDLTENKSSKKRVEGKAVSE